MEKVRHRGPGFSETVPGLQLKWDSVSRGLMLACPRKYELRVLWGLTEKRLDGMDARADLNFGLFAHAARGRYYALRAKGKDHEESLDEVVDFLLKVTWNRETGRPWVTGDPNKNRSTLLRSVVWYLDKWGENDPLETYQTPDGPAVELGLSVDVAFTQDEEPIGVCGHIDRVAKYNERIIPSDLKTTKHMLNQEYFRQYTPHDQMSGYIFLTQAKFGLQINSVLIDGMQVLVGGTRFNRGLVSRTTTQLSEWLLGTIELVKRAESYLRSGFFPQNPESCFRCEFRKICSASPSSRQAIMASDFAQRVWLPMGDRGEV